MSTSSPILVMYFDRNVWICASSPVTLGITTMSRKKATALSRLWSIFSRRFLRASVFISEVLPRIILQDVLERHGARSVDYTALMTCAERRRPLLVAFPYHRHVGSL